MENTALILVDIQNDYFQNGACHLEGEEQAAQNAAQLLKVFRERKLHIVHIEHEANRPDLGFMLPGSEGQRIHESVVPHEDETKFVKHFPNAFWQTGLEDHLKAQAVRRVVIAGMMTHMCVSATARAAMERGFEAVVVHDGCATRKLEFEGEEIPARTVHRTALAELAAIARIVSLGEFLNA